jgi:peptide-methionine (S)-S-oxide reductase
MISLFKSRKQQMVSPEAAIAGRTTPLSVPERHEVLGTPLTPPFPDRHEVATFALGCFWGAERMFWQLPGVFTTAAGYAGGFTENPTYEEVCSGQTGHAEAVLVVFDPSKVSYEGLLQVFFEGHDPTQGMRQGNDIGTQYRSAIFTHSDEQLSAAKSVRDRFQAALNRAGYGEITTQITEAGPFYYAEDYHQQYLAKNPSGYCGLGDTGVQLGSPSESCPTGLPLSDGASPS